LRLSAIPPASPAIAAPPASRGPLAFEARLPTLEAPGAFEAAWEAFVRVFLAAPFPDREARERVFVELPELRLPVLRPFDLARVRELRALVEEPLFFLDAVELRLERALDRVLWVAICIASLSRFRAGLCGARSRSRYPQAPSQTLKAAIEKNG
jgi:hypothetical protein